MQDDPSHRNMKKIFSIELAICGLVVAVWLLPHSGLFSSKQDSSNTPNAASDQSHKPLRAQEALQMAELHAGDFLGYQALVSVIEECGNDCSELSRDALRSISATYIGMEHDLDFLQKIGEFIDWPETETFLEEVRSQGASDEIRGFATLGLLNYLDDRAKHLQRQAATAKRSSGTESVGTSTSTPQTALQTEADTLRKRAVELRRHFVVQFADLEHEGFKPAPFQAGTLFDHDFLNVGQKAPDIEGLDTEGRPDRLSRHTGNVVVLSFSSTWCGPCKRYYPPQRRLIERHHDAPFSLVAVNQDDDLEAVQRQIDAGEYTWPVWFEGAKFGPIFTKWGVSKLPTVFVLDHRQVIRYKNPTHEELEEIVDRLIEEAQET